MNLLPGLLARRAVFPFLAALILATGLVAGATEEKARDHDHEADHRPTSTRSFDDIDRWVRVFDDPSRAEWQKPERIPAALGLKEGMAVADIGAGTGYFERFLAAAVGESGRVYAVDTEPKMVDHIRRRAIEEKTPNVEAVLAAPDDPRLPAAGVDVIFICDTWHHIGARIEYLGRLRAALRPGGRVAVVDFREGVLPVGPPPDHKIPARRVIAEFEEAGWSLLSESDLLPYQYFLTFVPPAPAVTPPAER